MTAGGSFARPLVAGASLHGFGRRSQSMDNIFGPTSRDVMMPPPKHLAYVLAHPEAWRLIAILGQGRIDRYEQVRKALGLHPQAFLRLLDQLSGFDLVWIRGDRTAKRPHGGPVPIHVELSPRGRAVLDVLHAMERAVRKHRERLGIAALTLPAVPV
jgi:DNA-binding MarR family transcriptional regulator